MSQGSFTAVVEVGARAPLPCPKVHHLPTLRKAINVRLCHAYVYVLYSMLPTYATLSGYCGYCGRLQTDALSSASNYYNAASQMLSHMHVRD